MKNAKYKFLKNYLETTKTSEDYYITDAFDNVSNAFECIKEEAKTIDTNNDFVCIIESFTKALDSQIEKIANCPFVKIEISNQEELTEVTKDIHETLVNTCHLQGSNQAQAQNLYKLAEAVAEVIKRSKENERGE